MRLICLAMLAALLSTPGWAQPASVAVTDAWSRASVPTAQTGAIYVTVTATQPDCLVGANTPAAATAQIHQSQMHDGVMEMREVPGGLPVLPGTPIHMVPGGYHIMLMGLKQPLKQGDHIPLSLTFEHAGVMAVEAIVAGPGASAPPPK